MGGVRTSIFGRPRPLPGHRRAATYTLICEEPVNGGPAGHAAVTHAAEKPSPGGAVLAEPNHCVFRPHLRAHPCTPRAAGVARRHGWVGRTRPGASRSLMGPGTAGSRKRRCAEPPEYLARSGAFNTMLSIAGLIPGTVRRRPSPVPPSVHTSRGGRPRQGDAREGSSSHRATEPRSRLGRSPPPNALHQRRGTRLSGSGSKVLKAKRELVRSMLGLLCGQRS